MNRSKKKIDIYAFSGIISNYSLAALFVLVILAGLDHFLFDERFRAFISATGKLCLFVFAIALILVIARSVYDKFIR